MRTQEQKWSREISKEERGFFFALFVVVRSDGVFLLLVGVSLFLDGLSSPSCAQSRDTQRPEDKHAHGTTPAAPYASYL